MKPATPADWPERRRAATARSPTQTHRATPPPPVQNHPTGESRWPAPAATRRDKPHRQLIGSAPKNSRSPSENSPKQANQPPAPFDHAAGRQGIDTKVTQHVQALGPVVHRVSGDLRQNRAAGKMICFPLRMRETISSSGCALADAARSLAISSCSAVSSATVRFVPSNRGLCSRPASRSPQTRIAASVCVTVSCSEPGPISNGR